jgi:hypothetical protein
MVWNKALPSNTTKLRNIGEDIRPNWEAIEDGAATFMPKSINLADLVGADAATVAAAVALYAKQDDANKPQVFAIDPDAVITQLTGNFSSAVNGAGWTHYTYVIPGGSGIIIKFGQCDSSNGAGSTLTFATKFPNACLGAIVTPTNSTATKVSTDSFLDVSFKAYNDVGTLSSRFIAWGN